MKYQTLRYKHITNALQMHHNAPQMHHKMHYKQVMNWLDWWCQVAQSSAKKSSFALQKR